MKRMNADMDAKGPFAKMAETYDSNVLNEQLVGLVKDMADCNNRLFSLIGVLIQKVENLERNFYGFSDYMTVSAPSKEMGK